MPKSLLIWDYLGAENTKLAVFKSCNIIRLYLKVEILCRYNYNKTNLVNHQKKNKQLNGCKSKKPSLKEVQEKVHIWDINDAQAKRVQTFVTTNHFLWLRIQDIFD